MDRLCNVCLVILGVVGFMWANASMIIIVLDESVGLTAMSAGGSRYFECH